MEFDAGGVELMAEVAQCFVKLFLARNTLGHVELATDLRVCLDQGDVVPAARRHGRGGQTGRPGTDPCQFNVPHELLVTEDNRVYVMDRENHRWQVFTTDGAFISLQEHVSHPNRVALDADGTFHIAGGAGIEIWKRDGTKIGSWGEKGEAPGQFVAGSVHGAWMDTDGSLYTAEAGCNNRLQKFVRV